MPQSTSETTKYVLQVKCLFPFAQMTLEASSAWNQMVSIDDVILVISAEQALTILHLLWISSIWNYCESCKNTSHFLHKRELPESQTEGTNLIACMYYISLDQKLVNCGKDQLSAPTACLRVQYYLKTSTVFYCSCCSKLTFILQWGTLFYIQFLFLPLIR